MMTVLTPGIKAKYAWRPSAADIALGAANAAPPSCRHDLTASVSWRQQVDPGHGDVLFGPAGDPAPAKRRLAAKQPRFPSRGRDGRRHFADFAPNPPRATPLSGRASARRGRSKPLAKRAFDAAAASERLDGGGPTAPPAVEPVRTPQPACATNQRRRPSRANRPGIASRLSRGPARRGRPSFVTSSCRRGRTA